MTLVRASITMSIDGYSAGPRQSEQQPMGEGGMRLHQWAFPLQFFHEMQGKTEPGQVNESDAAVREQQGNVGATIMGRNMFGPVRGRWSDSPTWTGWWGPNPPYHHPVFVLTHHARAPLTLEGGNVFHFVTGGVDAALAEARAVAGAKDIHVAGGASCIQQFLQKGLIDQITINVAPVFMSDGERLFDKIGDAMQRFTHKKTVRGPVATHLTFQRA